MSFNFQLHNDDDFRPEEEPMASQGQAGQEPAEHVDPLRLRLVDHLLSTAPMLAPRFDFAERVMKAIRQRQAQMNRNASLGLALGLAFSALLTLGLAAVGVISLVNIVLNWSRFYQQLVRVGGEIGADISQWLEAAQQAVAGSPVLIALALLSMPLFVIWLWVIRQLLPGEEAL